MPNGNHPAETQSFSKCRDDGVGLGRSEFSEKRVTVFGLNRSGLAVAKLLDALGAVVAVTDLRPPDALSSEIAELRGVEDTSGRHSCFKFYLGRHRRECIAHAECIVVSPGVPLDIPILCDARARSIPILAELEVAASLCSAPIVAITGTKGKSTTTLLTAAILKAGGTFAKVCIAGNIGVPLAAEVQHLTSRDIVVVEASSFQLESTVTFYPKVSVVLNLSRDHLDRHRTMSAYCKAKQKIYQNQTAADWIVLNRSDTRVARFAEFTSAKAVYFTDSLPSRDAYRVVPKEGMYPQTYREDRSIFANMNGVPQWICDVDDMPLRGAHNVRNVLAAIAVGQIFEVTPAQMREALQGFDMSHPALTHAFEPIRVLNGVEFINDSKATNVAAVKAALESIASVEDDGSIRPQRRILLIMGGYDKGNDYTPLSQMVRAHVKGAVMLGTHTQQIQKTLAKLTNIWNTRTMAEAVQVAYTHAIPGDIVLLSPANASFDMYPDYKARGAAFKEAVNALES